MLLHGHSITSPCLHCHMSTTIICNEVPCKVKMLICLLRPHHRVAGLCVSMAERFCLWPKRDECLVGANVKVAMRSAHKERGIQIVLHDTSSM